jgi:hypothetical protein
MRHSKRSPHQRVPPALERYLCGDVYFFRSPLDSCDRVTSSTGAFTVSSSRTNRQHTANGFPGLFEDPLPTGFLPAAPRSEVTSPLAQPPRDSPSRNKAIHPDSHRKCSVEKPPGATAVAATPRPSAASTAAQSVAWSKDRPLWTPSAEPCGSAFTGRTSGFCRNSRIVSAAASAVRARRSANPHSRSPFAATHIPHPSPSLWSRSRRRQLSNPFHYGSFDR